MKRTSAHVSRPNRRVRILKALEAGPLAAEPLAAAADTSYQDMGEVLPKLLREGAIIVLGTARELGIKMRRRNDARIYALPGTPKPQPARERTRKDEPRGEFAIAGKPTIRGFRWGWSAL